MVSEEDLIEEEDSIVNELLEGEVYPVIGVVIIDFYGSWCMPCKIMSPVFDELAGEVSNVQFFKANVDKNPTLVSEFNIFSVPTFIIIKDGKEIKRLSGIRDKAELKTLLEDTLK